MGAACMTALRMAAHRAGLIEKQVPQVVEEWMVQRSGHQDEEADGPLRRAEQGAAQQRGAGTSARPQREGGGPRGPVAQVQQLAGCLVSRRSAGGATPTCR